MKDKTEQPVSQAPMLDAALVAEDLQEQAREFLAVGDHDQAEDLVAASREVVAEPWPDES